jgi:hypothetical protein
MNYDNKIVAVSAIEHELCLLFFDLVHPIYTRDNRSEATWNYIPHAIGKDLIRRTNFDDFVRLHKVGLSTEIRKTSDANEIARQVSIRYLETGIKSIAIVSDNFSYSDKASTDDIDTIELSYFGAELIDSKNLNLEQVFEIRRDQAAIKKLRNYRLFISENFAGKSKQYTLDKLEQKIEDYHAACRKHGLDLVRCTARSIIDSKSILGICAIAAAGVLTGNPTVTNVSLISGAFLEIGKLALSLSEHKTKIKHYKDNHEIAYLIDLQQKK